MHRYSWLIGIFGMLTEEGMARFVSRTSQGRHAADFWRRPAAEDPRPPESCAAASCRSWKAIYFDEGLRRYGSILRIAHEITLLLDGAGLEIERIIGDQRIGNGMTVMFPSYRVLVGLQILELEVEGMAERGPAPSISPSCVRAGDLVAGLQAHSEAMAVGASISIPQPNTVLERPGCGLYVASLGRISHNLPSPNPRSRVTCGVVFVRDPNPPQIQAPSSTPPRFWQGVRSGDSRSFTQVVGTMDRRPPRRSPPRRSPMRGGY
jgi:hypothetical protein